MQAALLKTTMKKQIILLASLLVLSFQTLASDDITEPIPCDQEEGKMMVEAIVNEESEDSFEASLRAAGKKLKTQLEGILYNTKNAASKTDSGDIEYALKKASCIREVATGMNVSDDFMAKYKAHDKEIASKSGFNFLKMPTIPKTVEEKNQVNNYRLVYYNRDSFAFVRAMF